MSQDNLNCRLQGLLTDYRRTPQFYELVHQVLVDGADPNIRDVYGYLPLIFGELDYGGSDLQMIKLLLQFGANPNVQITPDINVSEPGDTPLHWVVNDLIEPPAGDDLAVQTYTRMFELFLSFGADPQIPNSYGLTPLDIAHESGVLLPRTLPQNQ